ncbi:MAG: UvrD-helicase domain-containing protein, partial [Bdellovibrionota bacterium]
MATKPPSPEQQRVIEDWGRGLAVTAGAGSGKTTTLVNKCVALLARNPEARFAAVSFTERSASDLRSKLVARLGSADSVGGTNALSGHWVMTIHGLCGTILREFPREAEFDGEETMLSEAESVVLWERATETIWREDLPEEARRAIDLLLARETREKLIELITRVRALQSFGALDFLARSEDPGSRALCAAAGLI